MKEYRLAKGWAIFIYIIAPIVIIVFVAVLVRPFIPGINDTVVPNEYWVLGPVSIGLIALMAIALIDTAKGRFIIAYDKISLVSAFSTKHLLFNEIKGYRINDKHIVVEPNVPGKKAIKISIYLSKTNEIKEWLATHYPDLDMLNVANEVSEILSNHELGWTMEQREEKLNVARKTAKILNWSGCIVGAWTFFRPDPYEYAIIASIALPIISLLALKFSSGLIRIDHKKESAYPSIFWAIFGTSVGLCLRAMFDFNIFNHSNIWTLAIMITFGMMAFILIGNKEFSFKKAVDYFTIIGVAIFLFGYGYGTVISLNCFYDTSEPEIFNATILNKRINSGKTKTYYFELTPWGQQKEVDEVTVTRELYDKLDKGNEVSVYFKKGQFQIPWFIVTE
jgi:hypothetical protein